MAEQLKAESALQWLCIDSSIRLKRPSVAGYFSGAERNEMNDQYTRALAKSPPTHFDAFLNISTLVAFE